jgi:hypothetical protein
MDHFDVDIGLFDYYVPIQTVVSNPDRTQRGKMIKITWEHRQGRKIPPGVRTDKPKRETEVRQWFVHQEPGKSKLKPKSRKPTKKSEKAAIPARIGVALKIPEATIDLLIAELLSVDLPPNSN